MRSGSPRDRLFELKISFGSHVLAHVIGSNSGTPGLTRRESPGPGSRRTDCTKQVPPAARRLRFEPDGLLTRDTIGPPGNQTRSLSVTTTSRVVSPDCTFRRTFVPGASVLTR